MNWAHVVKASEDGYLIALASLTLDTLVSNSSHIRLLLRPRVKAGFQMMHATQCMQCNVLNAGYATHAAQHNAHKRNATRANRHTVLLLQQVDQKNEMQ